MIRRLLGLTGDRCLSTTNVDITTVSTEHMIALQCWVNRRVAPKRFSLTCLCTIMASVLLLACQQQHLPREQLPPTRLTVFAAASLTNVFTEIGREFNHQASEVDLVFNFAGSQQLAQQLVQGAPADLFASADEQQMAIAIAADRVVADTKQIFAHNALVVIIPKSNPAQITTLQELAQSGLKIVLAADDVPVGQYSRQFLAQASADSRFDPTYAERVLANVVSSEQNVRAVLTKVVLGEADAGIVYSSDVTAEVRDQLRQLAIPDELNVRVTYPIAVVTDSAHPDAAQQFIDLLLSTTGQEILARYGFLH